VCSGRHGPDRPAPSDSAIAMPITPMVVGSFTKRTLT
jgi:hypothetical protein